MVPVRSLFTRQTPVHCPRVMQLNDWSKGLVEPSTSAPLGRSEAIWTRSEVLRVKVWVWPLVKGGTRVPERVTADDFTVTVVVFWVPTTVMCELAKFTAAPGLGSPLICSTVIAT